MMNGVIFALKRLLVFRKYKVGKHIKKRLMLLNLEDASKTLKFLVEYLFVWTQRIVNMAMVLVSLLFSTT